MREDIWAYLQARTAYAVESRSVTMMHEVYGEAKMARTLNAIDRDAYFELTDALIGSATATTATEAGRT